MPSPVPGAASRSAAATTRPWPAAPATATGTSSPTTSATRRPRAPAPPPRSTPRPRPRRASATARSANAASHRRHRLLPPMRGQRPVPGHGGLQPTRSPASPRTASRPRPRAGAPPAWARPHLQPQRLAQRSGRAERRHRDQRRRPDPGRDELHRHAGRQRAEGMSASVTGGYPRRSRSPSRSTTAPTAAPAIDAASGIVERDEAPLDNGDGSLRRLPRLVEHRHAERRQRHHRRRRQLLPLPLPPLRPRRQPGHLERQRDRQGRHERPGHPDSLLHRTCAALSSPARRSTTDLARPAASSPSRQPRPTASPASDSYGSPPPPPAGASQARGHAHLQPLRLAHRSSRAQRRHRAEWRGPRLRHRRLHGHPGREPPTSSILCDGASCAGWHPASVSVTLSSSDTGSGLDEIRYDHRRLRPDADHRHCCTAAPSPSRHHRDPPRGFDRVGNAEAVHPRRSSSHECAPSVPVDAHGEPGRPRPARSGTTAYYRPGGGRSGTFTVEPTSDPRAGNRKTFRLIRRKPTAS